MSLVFGGGVETFAGPRFFSGARRARLRRSPAQALLSRATALLRGEHPINVPSAWLSPARREEMELHDAFDRIADAAGLSQDERAVICGGSRALSGVVLALETIGAALELFPVPAAALCWLRGETVEEPFCGRSPMAMMAADGRLGVEMTLLRLRARLRRERRA